MIPKCRKKLKLLASNITKNIIEIISYRLEKNKEEKEKTQLGGKMLHRKPTSFGGGSVLSWFWTWGLLYTAFKEIKSWIT